MDASILTIDQVFGDPRPCNFPPYYLERADKLV